MTTTARKTILDNMVNILGQLSAFTTVSRWRDTDADPYEPAECPALNIKDTTASIEHQVSQDEHALKIQLDIHTTSRITADAVESLLADVAAAVNTNQTWSGTADGTSIENHDININQTGDTITSAGLDIIVHYTTDRGMI